LNDKRQSNSPESNVIKIDFYIIISFLIQLNCLSLVFVYTIRKINSIINLTSYFCIFIYKTHLRFSLLYFINNAVVWYSDLYTNRQNITKLVSFRQSFSHVSLFRQLLHRGLAILCCGVNISKPGFWVNTKLKQTTAK